MEELSSENFITEFQLAGIPNRGMINNTENIVLVAHPFRDEMQYTAQFSLSEGAVSEPESGSSFSPGSHSLRVTAEDGTQRVYELVLEYREKTALLIIDLQNANFPVYNQTEVLANINKLRRNASGKAPTIFIQHTDTGPWMEGSHTWQINNAVQPSEDDILLRKSTISAMTPELKDTLNNLGVYRIILTGTLTDLCIAQTIKPAYRSGYHVIVPLNAHSTNLDNPEEIIRKFYRDYNKYIDVYPVDEIDFSIAEMD